MNFVEKMAQLESLRLPLPVMECSNCHGTIYRMDDWFQCPDCDDVKTAFDHLHLEEMEGKKLTPLSGWRDLCTRSKRVLGWK